MVEFSSDQHLKVTKTGITSVDFGARITVSTYIYMMHKCILKDFIIKMTHGYNKKKDIERERKEGRKKKKGERKKKIQRELGS